MATSPWFVDVQIEGVKETTDRFERLRKALGDAGREELRDTLLENAEILKRWIETFMPRPVTGRLARSVGVGLYRKPIVASFVRMDYKIAPHAHLVEYGTSHSAAHPYFRRGIETAWPMILQNIERKTEYVIARAA